MTGRHESAAFGVRKAPVALLILDMLSDYRFPDGIAAVRAARRIAPNIARLRARAAKEGVPTIYVNDNLGRWRSSLDELLARCLAPGARGADVVGLLKPGPEDLVVLKPRHSAFYATPLAALLDEARTRRIILTGVSSHQCVLFTANDAHVRELELCVPADCIGAPAASQTRFALRYFGSVLGAGTEPSTRLRLRERRRR